MAITKLEMITQKQERLGEIIYNKHGSKMTIIEYIDSHNMTVRFDNGFITQSSYKQFKNCTLGSPYDKSVYGIGFIGEGQYKVSINKVLTKEYNAWNAMLNRCYSTKYHNIRNTYIDCTVSEEWHDFQVFSNWFNENYYEIGNERMCLDKDILHKGNKIYSANNCIYVPEKINILFVKCDKSRGVCPIGVCCAVTNNKYLAQCSDNNNKKVHLGTYNNPTDAFYKGYKSYKEQLIKQVADKYKTQIPNKLYITMYDYEVEIND